MSEAWACDACAAAWLPPEGKEALPCPRCGADALQPAGEGAEAEPEQAVPPTVDRGAAIEALAAFIRPLWFRTADLDAERLAERLQPVWWPLWLVDADVDGSWEAEAGFDYTVRSTLEAYAGGTWTTREVPETRVRWEPRGGTVRRRYDNVAVSALTDQAERDRALGPPSTAAVPWPVGEPAWIRLPDRSTREQWPEALAAIREVVAEDCAAACAAQHIREVYLDMSAEQAAWTWRLVPGWATWYDDDEGVRRVLRVHGTSGKCSGPRLASPKKGWVWGAALASSAVLCAVVGVVIGVVGILIWPLLVLAGVVLAVGLVLGCVAVWPLVGPLRNNRRELAD